MTEGLYPLKSTIMSKDALAEENQRESAHILTEIGEAASTWKVIL